MAQRSNVNLVVTDEDEESHSSNVSEENIKGAGTGIAGHYAYPSQLSSTSHPAEQGLSNVTQTVTFVREQHNIYVQNINKQEQIAVKVSAGDQSSIDLSGSSITTKSSSGERGRPAESEGNIHELSANESIVKYAKNEVMNNLKKLEVMHHIAIDVTTEVSEVHPVFHDIPVDYFLGKLDRKQEYKPTTSLIGDQSFITNSTQTIEFENLLCDERKRNVLLGDAGTGKSVTLKRMIKKTANNEIASMKNEEFIIFLELKHFAQDEEKQYIWEFIIGAAGAKLEEECKKELFKWMIKNENKIVLFFDGLDQCPLQFVHDDTLPPITNYYRKHSINHVLRDIFAGHLFGNSKLLFTSRQFAMKNLPENCWPTHLTNMGGLATENVEKLVLDMAGMECLKYFQEENEELLNMASNPLYLTFGVATFIHEKKNCPNTLTGVMLCVISNFFNCDHARLSSAEILPKLCSLAFEGTVQCKVTFLKEDFENHHIDSLNVADFMIAVPSKQPGSVIRSKIILGNWSHFFIHQSVQELFAALKITQDFTLIEQLSIEQFIIVERLLHGICCNKDNMKYLKLLKGLNFNDISQQRDKLLDRLKQQLKEVKRTEHWSQKLRKTDAIRIKGFTEDNKQWYMQYWKNLQNTGQSVISKNFADDRLIRIIHEGKITNYVEIEIVDLSFLPLDAHLIQMMTSIIKKKSMNWLSFQYCNLTSDLLHILRKHLGDEFPGAVEMSVNGNPNIVDVSLAYAAQAMKIQELWLVQCAITKEGLEKFVKSLKPDKKFNIIYMSMNRISSDMVPALTKLMQHVKQLRLDDRSEYISEETIKVIREASTRYKDMEVIWWEDETTNVDADIDKGKESTNQKDKQNASRSKDDANECKRRTIDQENEPSTSETVGKRVKRRRKGLFN